MLAPAHPSLFASAPDARGWSASLAVTLAPRRGRTRVVARRHEGPLVIQRAFHPPDEPCHLLLLHPPGGVVGRDRLETTLELEPGAECLATAPGATKVYRSDERVSTTLVRLRVPDGAALEWLPHETIVFDGAHGTLGTGIELGVNARFIGWEILCLGRPACGERFERGRLEQDVQCLVDGRALHAERWELAGGDPALAAPWGLDGHPVFATLQAWRCEPADVDVARDALAGLGAVTGGVTLLEGLLVARLLGPRTEQVREALEAIWRALRPTVIGRPHRRPRIWNT